MRTAGLSMPCDVSVPQDVPATHHHWLDYWCFSCAHVSGMSVLPKNVLTPASQSIRAMGEAVLKTGLCLLRCRCTCRPDNRVAFRKFALSLLLCSDSQPH